MAQLGTTANGGPIHIANDINADQINNITVATTTPTNGQVLNYNSTTSQWEPTTVSAADERVGIDSGATAGYLGAASNDGVLRTGSELSYTDGGDFVTIGIAANGVDDTHIDWGTGANQVSAVDVPIADSGGIITGTEVETALQENRTAVDLNTTHRGSDGKNHSDVVLNNTHRSSNGSDHSYIDQDVTSGSSPTFGGAKAGRRRVGSWDIGFHQYVQRFNTT